MGGIIDHFQPMLVGNGLYGINITWVSINMCGEDCCGFGRNGGFNFIRVEFLSFGLNVYL
jgi:hypothetical protein